MQDLLSSLNAVISTNKSTQFITGHVIYNPAYTYKFQLKTTLVHKLDYAIYRASFCLPFSILASGGFCYC